MVQGKAGRKKRSAWVCWCFETWADGLSLVWVCVVERKKEMKSMFAFSFSHQSSIINHQSSIINPQSSIINHQPSTINHQSTSWSRKGRVKRKSR